MEFSMILLWIVFSDNSINKQNTTHIDSISMKIKVFVVKSSTKREFFDNENLFDVTQAKNIALHSQSSISISSDICTFIVLTSRFLQDERVYTQTQIAATGWESNHCFALNSGNLCFFIHRLRNSKNFRYTFNNNYLIYIICFCHLSLYINNFFLYAFTHRREIIDCCWNFPCFFSFSVKFYSRDNFTRELRCEEIRHFRILIPSNYHLALIHTQMSRTHMATIGVERKWKALLIRVKHAGWDFLALSTRKAFFLLK